MSRNALGNRGIKPSVRDKKEMLTDPDSGIREQMYGVKFGRQTAWGARGAKFPGRGQKYF